VSLQVAERGLALGVAIWHSLPGTLLLYGAATLHIALALHAIYQRRTLRMPPLELLRIWMGLAIPLLLIGHVVLTRTAWELYDAAPRYARVAWNLWAAGAEGMQLAMLVPGWLHGCLGVHLAFSRRAWYARLPPLFARAADPVLGAPGSGDGRELARHGAATLPADARARTDRSVLRTCADALAIYFATTAASRGELRRCKRRWHSRSGCHQRSVQVRAAERSKPAARTAWRMSRCAAGALAARPAACASPPAASIARRPRPPSAPHCFASTPPRTCAWRANCARAVTSPWCR
jgi:adenylate cyclase